MFTLNLNMVVCGLSDFILQMESGMLKAIIIHLMKPQKEQHG